MEPSAVILERFRTGYGKDIDLTLRAAYRDLLESLGNPHDHLPPVIHVAGTNGKGSTCAFLRAFLEAAGLRVHVYTSPHLVSLHERIRIAGTLISEEELAAILTLCEEKATPHGVSFFEASTAAAFYAFAHHPADVTILEVGLGGRLDATNVVEKPLATVIARLSLDHCEFLGTTMDQIAREKAGIMKKDVPCFAMAQPSLDARAALIDCAAQVGCTLFLGDRDYFIEDRADGFRFRCDDFSYDYPPPALVGRHQYANAGLAMAVVRGLSLPIDENAIRDGLRRVDWPARLQPIRDGALRAQFPAGCEVWLDGGHNDSAGEALAAQITAWKHQDGAETVPLYVIFSMIETKDPRAFLAPFAHDVTHLCALPIPDEAQSLSPESLAIAAQDAGVGAGSTHETIEDAFDFIRLQCHNEKKARVLMCGSLYLAGAILKKFR